MRLIALFFALALTFGQAFADDITLLGVGQGSVISASSLTFNSLANGTQSSTVAGGGGYTGAAPSGLTSVTFGGGCAGSGPSTVTGFSAAAGSWSATFSTTSAATAGCTITATGTGSNTHTAISPPACFTNYTGPGDINSSWAWWFGVRGYNTNSACTSATAMTVTRISDSTTKAIKILANGALDITSANTFAGTDATSSCTIASTSAVCTSTTGTIHVNDPVSGASLTQPCMVTATNGSTTATVSLAGTSTTCGTISVAETMTFQVAMRVSPWIDQTGNVSAGATNGTLGSQPLLLPSCQSGLPCLHFNNYNLSFTAPSSVTQPYSITEVVNVVGYISPQTYPAFFTSGNSNLYVGPVNVPTTTNQWRINAGADVVVTATAGLTHIGNGLLNGNGTSSIFNVDGTDHTGAAGTQASGTFFSVGAYIDLSGNHLNGYEMEIGLLPGTSSRATLCTQQFVYYATGTSC